MRAGLVGLEAHEGVDGLLEDGVGVFLGDLLDLDAALGGGDEDVAPGVAVGGDGEVVLVGDVDAGGDEELGDVEALGAGLGETILLESMKRGGVGGVGGGVDELDEAGLAAAAGVDLGLDDGEVGVRRSRARVTAPFVA
jgi:hypothetical protein